MVNVNTEIVLEEPSNISTLKDLQNGTAFRPKSGGAIYVKVGIAKSRKDINIPSSTIDDGSCYAFRIFESRLRSVPESSGMISNIFDILELNPQMLVDVMDMKIEIRPSV